MAEWLVLDLGGSIIAPADSAVPDAAFSADILGFLNNWLQENELRRLALVVGGGAVARRYQQAARQFAAAADEALDWLGIRATHLNAQYLHLLATTTKLVTQPLLTQYQQLPPVEKLGRIVVGGGWKPGFSTDYDSVLLAEHVGATRLLCLSNIAQIYNDDPAQNLGAQALAELDWVTYQQMTGSTWTPGRSLPFDPVAAKYAAKIGLELVFAAGRDLENLAKILNGADFIGTVVR